MLWATKHPLDELQAYTAMIMAVAAMRNNYLMDHVVSEHGTAAELEQELQRASDELEKHLMARRHGGMARWAADPAQAAKHEARALWPEAHRRGWSAERMWAALCDAGHDVRADTVRKWMTKLRRTGTC